MVKGKKLILHIKYTDNFTAQQPMQETVTELTTKMILQAGLYTAPYND